MLLRTKNLNLEAINKSKVEKKIDLFSIKIFSFKN